MANCLIAKGKRRANKTVSWNILGWYGLGPVGSVHSKPQLALLHYWTEINKVVVRKQLVFEYCVLWGYIKPEKEKNRSTIHFKLNASLILL